MDKTRKISAEFVGFGEVNTPKGFIVKRCATAAKMLEQQEIELIKTASVSDDPEGGNAAVFMSLIATCKANGINPHEYLKDILARINSHPFRKLAELVPHNWKAAA